MRILGVELRGFRRFLNADVELDTHPIAIIGRNEAGKSSFLEALTRLNDDTPIVPSAQTRGYTFDDNHPVIRAWFALEEDEIRAISGIPEAIDARRIVISKTVDGSISGEFHPPVLRDLRLREKTQRQSDRVARTKWFSETDIESDLFERVRSSLQSSIEELEEPQILDFELLASRLPAEPEKSLPAVLGRELARLAETERLDTPSKRATELLLPLRPRFLLFAQGDRDLETVYDLSVSAPSPSPALSNIAGLADLDLVDANRAYENGNYGRLTRLVREANERLQAFFSTAWRQSAMHIQIRIDKNELRIQVDNLQGDLTSIEERSAGLQTFVALVAFLTSSGSDRPPIVLIDEAETHLHYDAQADLVRVLSKQDAAAKVIYTTHSAGCLPLDLGLGIRAVIAEPNDTSRVENSVWELGPGLSPTLLAMGASVLAFSRARRAIVGEGGSEAQLLPTLLREAVPEEEVDYQIAPGLANATDEAIRDLELEAVSVGYVLDSDQGGRDKAKQIRSIGIPDTRIAFLGGTSRSGVTLEDLVSREVYHRAVNQVFDTWGPPRLSLPLTAIPKTGRAKALEKWCAKRTVKSPDKRVVAARILAQRGNTRLLDSPRKLTTAESRAVLTQLHADILQILGRSRPADEDVAY